MYCSSVNCTNNKTFFLNERVYEDIKTEKAQEQDWDGTLTTKLNTVTNPTQIYIARL